MAPRSSIIAGKTVILLEIQESIDNVLNTIGRKINKFSAGINKLSFELFQGGLFGSLPIGLALRDFKTFEDAILFLSTKLLVTEKEMTRVENVIRQLGRSTSFTAQEVANAATQLAQAGFNSVEVTNSLQSVLDLARGNQIEIEASAAILANTLRVFRIETSKSAEVASQFTAAARLGTLNVIDLKESLKEVVGTLNTLNIDLPTTLALVTQLAQSSLKGTKAGTSLNTALLQLASKQDIIKESLGIDIVDVRGNLRPIIDILDELFTSLNKLGNTTKLAVLQRIFNIRGGRAITGLLRDLDRVRELSQEIRNAGNEARIAAIKMDSGFGGALRIAISAVQDLSIELGKITAGPLTDFLKLVPPITAAIQELADANPGVVLSFAALPAIMLAVGASGLVASFALNKIAGVIKLLGGGVSILGTTLNKVLTTQLILLFKLLRAIKIPTLLKSFSKLGKIKFGSGISKFFSSVSLLKLVPSLTSIQKGFAKTIKIVDNFATSIEKLTGVSKVLVSILSSISSIASLLTFPGVGTFIKPKSVFLIAITNIRVQIRQLRIELIALKATLLTTVKSFDLFRASMKFTGLLGGLISSINKFFLAFAKGPSTLKGFLALGTFLNKTVYFLAKGNLAAAIRPIRLLAVLDQFKGTFFVSATKNLLLFAKAGIGTLSKGLNSLAKVDYVRVLYRLVTTPLLIAKSFTIATFRLVRFAFSLSGIVTLLELLLLLGPKIPIVAEQLNLLGTGIIKAFSAVFNLGDLKTAFGLFQDGISSIFRGDGVIGVGQITKSLELMAKIVKSNLKIAWNELRLAIAPTYDLLRKIIGSVIELGKLTLSIFGVGFSAIGKGVAGFFGGAGGLGDISGLIKSLFSNEGLAEGTKLVGATLVEIGKSLLSIAEFQLKIVNQAMKAITIAAEAILSVFASLLGGAANSGFIKTLGLEQAFKDAANVIKLIVPGFKDQLAAQNQFNIALSRIFDDARNQLDNTLNKFGERIDGIFKNNLADQARRDRAQAENEKAQLQREAQLERNRAALAATQSLPGKLGELLAKPFLGLQLPSLPGFGADPKNALSGFINFGKAIGPKLVSQFLANAPNQEEIIKAKIKDLNQSNAQSRAQINKNRIFGEAFLGKDSGQLIKDLNDPFITSINSRKEEIEKLRSQLRGLTQRQSSVGRIEDVVAAATGTFEQTRFNKVKAVDNSTKQIDLLERISGQLGDPSGDSYLKKLVDRATPLVFQ